MSKFKWQLPENCEIRHDWDASDEPARPAATVALLHIALWNPPPVMLRPIAVLEQPDVRIYAEHWGRVGDVGVVAQHAGEDIGACWIRLLPAGVGLASVDQHTLQLGTALEREHQGKGLGETLMRAALQAAVEAGHRQLSLTVHPENPAQSIDKRCGFQKIVTRNNYILMLVSLAPSQLPGF